MSGVNLHVELTDDQAYRAAQFFKRMYFQTVLDYTDGHLRGQEKIEDAYKTQEALMVFARELEFQGYAPR